jgi:hypothetical protein
MKQFNKTPLSQNENGVFVLGRRIKDKRGMEGYGNAKKTFRWIKRR